MSNPLAEKHAEAKRLAEELERDLRDLERITSKYGLQVVGGAPAAASPSRPLRTNNFPDPNSVTTRSRSAAAEIIRRAGRPVPIGELYSSALKGGLKVGGKNPKSAFSAYLSHSSDFENLPGRGWWFKKLGHPPELPRHANGQAAFVT